MTFGMQKDDKITFCWRCFRQGDMIKAVFDGPVPDAKDPEPQPRDNPMRDVSGSGSKFFKSTYVLGWVICVG